MYTTTEIEYDGIMQVCLIMWDWEGENPKMAKVLIGTQDVTKELGYMNRSKIKIAVAEAAKMRSTV